MTLAVSSQLIAHLQQWELFRPNAYEDSVAMPPRWTIGYGETDGVKEGDTITQPDALIRLHARLDRDFGPAVWAALPRFRDRMLSHEFDACVALAYNIGPGAFTGSTIAAMLNRGDSAVEAAEHFIDWIHAGTLEVDGVQVPREVPNLRRRRAREMRVFLVGW